MTSAITVTRTKHYGDLVIDKIHHIYTTDYSLRTWCKRRFKTVPWIHAEDVFTPGEDVWTPIDVCEDCVQSDEFQERLALHLLAEVGEESNRTAWIEIR